MNRFSARMRCFRPVFGALPFAERDDARDQVERQRAVDVAAVGVHGEGDALHARHHVGGELAFGEFAAGQSGQVFDQAACGRGRPSAWISSSEEMRCGTSPSPFASCCPGRRIRHGVMRRNMPARRSRRQASHRREDRLTFFGAALRHSGAKQECGLLFRSLPCPRRRVLITGAARIGAAIARRLHADGCDVALHYRDSAADMHGLVDELEAGRQGSTLMLQADLAVFDRLPELVARTVGHFGRLDALVNNASAFYPTPVGGATRRNGRNCSRSTRARHSPGADGSAAPAGRTRRHRQHRRHLCRETARTPGVRRLHKAALLAVSRGLAASLAPEVWANAVLPGAILWPDGGIDPHVQDRLLAQTPLGRIGDPGDIAGTVAWLLGNTAGYVTGQVIHVDGGRHIT